MDLPKNLVNQVRQGRAVLFLGAGATKGAQKTNGREPPEGTELRDLIARKYLSGDYSQESLSWVAELATANTDLFEVQDFIAEQFLDLKPTSFHLLIPTFRWRGIATTNYDMLVETVYRLSNEPVQKLTPFLSNNDRIDGQLRDPSYIPHSGSFFKESLNIKGSQALAKRCSRR